MESPGKVYELCVLHWTAAMHNAWNLPAYFRTPGRPCDDHHVTNKGFAVRTIRTMLFLLPAPAVGALYLAGRQQNRENTAECLYTGIVHDTGVFKYSNTSKERWRLPETWWTKA